MSFPEEFPDIWDDPGGVGTCCGWGTGGPPPLGPRTLPPGFDTVPRRDSRALCLSVVEGLVGTDPDGAVSSWKDIFEVANDGLT